MSRLEIMAAIVVLAACSTNCGSASDTLTSPAAPSAVASSAAGEATSAPDEAISTPLARGGGGGRPKPSSGSTSSSFALKMVTDANADGLPNWGDSVTFDVTTTATTEPHVDLTCSQNGTVVYGATTGFYASYPWPWTTTMGLSSASWQSGPASCVAKLYYFSGASDVTLKSISFTAGA